MFIGRKSEIDKISNWLIDDSDSSINKKIVNIYGMFGTGKSFLLDFIENDLFSSKSIDGVVKLDDCSDISFLTDLGLKLLTLLKSNSLNKTEISFIESAFNKKRFSELLKIIREHDTSLFEKFYQKFRLKTNFDFLLNDNLADIINKNYEVINQYINNHVPNNNDKNIFQEIERHISESVIIDFIMAYYPDLEMKIKSGLPVVLDKPKKILILIDNYDNISGSVNNWLFEHLFNYCYEKSFNDFVSYNINFLDPNLKINCFIDFRYILSSRNKIDSTQFPEFQKSKYVNMEFIEINQFSIDEIDDFIEAEKITPYIDIKSILDFTNGIPYLLYLLTESMQLNTGLEDDVPLINHLASEQIMKYLTEEQKDWLRCASFLDSFDKNALICFSQLRNNINPAFTFLQSSCEFSEPIERNLFRIKPIIKKFIVDAVQSESLQLSIEYQKIASAYNEVKDILTSLSPVEFHYLRSLAFFNYFETTFSIQRLFRKSASDVIEFIKKNLEYFIQSKYSYFVKPEYKSKLLNFSIIYDKSDYDEKVESVQYIWDLFSYQLNGKSHEIALEKGQLKSELGKLHDEQNFINNKYDEINSRHLSNESDFQSIKKKFDTFKKKTNIKYPMLYLVLSALFLIAGLSVNTFINKNLPEPYFKLITDGSYIISAIIFIISIILFFRSGKNQNNKEMDKILRDKMNDVERQIQKEAEDMKSLKETLHTNDKLISDINAILIELDSEIATLSEKLEESFVIMDTNG